MVCLVCWDAGMSWSKYVPTKSYYCIVGILCRVINSSWLVELKIHSHLAEFETQWEVDNEEEFGKFHDVFASMGSSKTPKWLYITPKNTGHPWQRANCCCAKPILGAASRCSILLRRRFLCTAGPRYQKLPKMTSPKTTFLVWWTIISNFFLPAGRLRCLEELRVGCHFRILIDGRFEHVVWWQLFRTWRSKTQFEIDKSCLKDW